MAEVFKCGDIANLINDNNTKIKPKKRSKLAKKFEAIIEENRNKVIEINKNEDFGKTVDTSDDDEDEDEEVDRQSPKRMKQKPKDSEEKNERTVFVGNLPKIITKKLLMQMFKKIGAIESVRLRGGVPQKEKMSKKIAVITKSLHPGKDNLIGYVVFKSRDDVSKALELNGTELGGHHIRVDSAIHDTTHDNTQSVFVGNLPFVIKEDELYEFFGDCGDIESVRVIRDSATGVGKGFGFISFKSKDSVVLALEKNEKQLLGRELRVTRAKAQNNKKERYSRTKNNNSDKTENMKKSPKKVKKSDSRPEFEGISAKKIKKKTNKKKEILSKRTKKKQKKLSQIFSH